jgi:hypothetical protein
VVIGVLCLTPTVLDIILSTAVLVNALNFHSFPAVPSLPQIPSPPGLSSPIPYSWFLSCCFSSSAPLSVPYFLCKMVMDVRGEVNTLLKILGAILFSPVRL